MNIFDAHISGALSVSGSGEISNDLLISGNLTVLGWISGSVSGNITSADTASYAPKYTLTSSFEAFTSSYTTGSFTGSFAGNGAGLYNIPASGVTGLNLNRIADGSATASISQADGLVVNSNAEFTGSVKITGSIYLNGQPIGTGKLDETVFNSYTSSNNNRVSSLETSSGSLNTFTSSTNVRLNAIETSTSSLNLFTSSISTTIKNKLNSDGVLSGSIQVSLTGTTDFTAFSTSISQSISKSLSDSKDYTDLKLALYDPVFTNISALEIATASLNSFTSSINTTIKNKLNNDGVISGSIQVNLTGTTGYSTFSSSIATNDLNQNNRIDSLESASSSIRNDFNSYTGSNNTTNTTQNNRLTSIETSTSSLNSYTSSNTTNINAIHTATSSLNSFSSSILGAVEVTGSNLTVKGNLLVKGTTTQIDSTTLNIGDNIISLNGTATNNGGLVIQDASGASTVSGSLLWDTSTDYWKAGKLGSEERIILVNEYNTFSTSINSRATSLETSTSSLNSYTSSNNTRLNTIESTTGSLNTFTSSTSNRLTAIETATGSLNTYTSSNNIRLNTIESTTGSLNTFTSSANSRLNSLESASGSIRADFNSYTSSNDSTNSTQNSRLNSLESTSGSLNSYTSSNNTRLNTIESTTASLNSYTSSNTTSINAIHTATSSLNSYTSSNNTRLNTIETSTGSLNTFTSSASGRLTAIETSTSSLNSFTSSINTTIKNKLNSDGVISGSVQVTLSSTTGYSTFSQSLATTDASQDSRLTSIETSTSSLNSYTSSTNTRLNTIESSTSSLNSFTSSINTTIKNKLNTDGVISGSAQVTLSNTTGYSTFSSSLATTDANQDSRLNSIEGKTGSYATTGSNIFQGNQIITGSLYVSQDLIIAGSSSIQHISSSVVNIADNIITVNAQNPSIRFGGLAVIDSGSSPQVSGSLLFDSVENQWLFVHQNQSSVTSALLIMGPESYNNIGGETHLTINRLPKSINDEHIGDSNITDTGTKVSVNSNTEITGSLIVTGDKITVNAIGGDEGGEILLGKAVTNTTLSGQGVTIDIWQNRLRFFEQGGNARGAYLDISTLGNGVATNLNVTSNITALESTTASLNSYTSSNTTNINAIHTATSSLNSFTSSQITHNNAVNTSTSSLNTFTSSAGGRLTAIETSTSSLNTFTSSAGSRLTTLESTTGSLNTFTSSAGNRLTSIESTTSSLNTFTSSASGRLTAIESTTASLNTSTASLNSYTSSNNIRLNTIESTTGSLNTFTSSASSRLTAIETSTSSLNSFTSSQITFNTAHNTATSSLNSYTSSNTTNINAIHTATASLNSFTSSANGRLNSIESVTGSIASLNTYTGSNNTVIGTLQATTSSLNSYTSSNTTNINAIHTATASLNTFTNSFNSAFSLSGTDVTVKGNFTVSGTTTTVNSTTVAIGDNIIQLNGTGATNAGLVVRDAQGTLTSGSLLWDTTNDKWIAGPLGSEDDVVLRTATQTLTNKTINASQLIDATVTNAKLQNSAITIAGTSTSLGGSITAATILTGTGVVSGSYVSSIAGTTNQVSVSAATGAVTLSLPQDIHTGATPTFSGLTTNGRAQIGGTDSRGVLTVQTGSTQTFSANTDPTDSGRFFVMQNTSTTNAAGQYSNITLQINPGGTIGTGRVLGDIRLVRNTLNGTSSRFIFSAFRDDATYKDYLTLDYTGASFAGSINGLTVSSGTITTGTWNGTAIANAYLANSSFYVGTTSISLGRASASQTLTGVSIDGTAANITTSSNTSITSLSNLATVGTITSGTWNGGVVAVSYGGTGLSSLTANRIPYGNGTSAFQSSANLTFDGSTLAISGTLTATVKSFTIDHPTKEGLKLQYGVLEGPEHAVYVRGKLVGENKIVLPDYWYALIHEDTITVNLTPIGSQQVLYVESVNSNEIIVGGDANINCYYTVFAERKDVDKLITEHE